MDGSCTYITAREWGAVKNGRDTDIGKTLLGGSRKCVGEGGDIFWQGLHGIQCSRGRAWVRRLPAAGKQLDLGREGWERKTHLPVSVHPAPHACLAPCSTCLSAPLCGTAMSPGYRQCTAAAVGRCLAPVPTTTFPSPLLPSCNMCSFSCWGAVLGPDSCTLLLPLLHSACTPGTQLHHALM